MGNRAVIASGPSPDSIGVYVHWNGGRASVEAFLNVARQLEFRDPAHDSPYAMARLCSIVCVYFGLKDSLSVGIGPLSKLDCDNGDNGTYIIGKDWRIIGRKYMRGSEEVDQSKTIAITREILEKINKIVEETA